MIIEGKLSRYWEELHVASNMVEHPVLSQSGEGTILVTSGLRLVEPSPVIEPTVCATPTPVVEASLLEFTGHTADVWSVDISPDGKTLVTASHDKIARLWDITTRQTIQAFSPCTAEGVAPSAHLMESPSWWAAWIK